MINNIIYLGHHDKAITGGHKYNEAFEEHLEIFSGIKIQKVPSCTSVYKGWRKLISPIAELKWLKLINTNSLLFFSDTLYKYHIMLAIINKYFCKGKTTVIIHHFPFIGAEGFGAPINKWLMIKFYGLMDSIIVPSPYTLDVAKSIFPKKDIYYIPLPFERKFQPSNNYEPRNLVFVGTIEPRKGLKYLLEAMVIYSQNTQKKLSLNVIGKIVDQRYKVELDTYIKKNQLSVNFLGRVSDLKLYDCYKKAEVFAFPSLLEGYGIVLIEAMQKGLPVICFNNTAMPYTIKDEVNGCLAKNKDSSDFALKLIKIVECKENRIKLQSGMQETINNVKTIDDFHEGIQKFWSSVK